jgi:transcriptional regulator with XRE-family HTH domain
MSPRSFPRDDSLAGLGRAIHALRIQRRLTQEQLAERAEVHASYISVIEGGGRNLTWTALKKISAALGVTVSDLARKAEALERD